MRKYLFPSLRFIFILLISLTSICAIPIPPSHAQAPEEPPHADGTSEIEDEKIDEFKTSDQLLLEADFLLDDSRLLDARTKLLRALKKDPKNYRAHMLLSGYYLVHVGHFRLALRYIRQAESLFNEQHGAPPYSAERTIAEHQQIIYLVSQALLNLDDYAGALASLDDFEKLHYSAPWYSGTRAWILMKLGRVPEAIKIAREGMKNDSEPGRTLNMLGILLSMNGEPEESLQVFRDAVSWELSQGSQGQPATPLNNAGEVYREIFLDEKAESSWLRAISMPDGCEHVLPSLNLAILYFDQWNLDGAKKAFDSFESCTAQFPLRNGEEHKALVAFGRGRIALLSGHTDQAITLFNQAKKDRQWFGKIGTSEDDLLAATLQSLSAAHYAQANRLALQLPDESSWLDAIDRYQNRMTHEFLGWWFERKARRLLAETLNDFEDIVIRNTDALLEYPTLGMTMRGFSTAALERRIAQAQKGDRRKMSGNFYEAYRAENLIEHGDIAEGMTLAQQALSQVRPHFDDLLQAHLQALMLKQLDSSSTNYQDIAEELFALNRILLRDRGLVMPVGLSIGISSGGDAERQQILKAAEAAGFIQAPRSKSLVNISIIHETDGTFKASVSAPVAAGGSMQLKAQKLSDVLNRLTDTMFSVEVSG